MSSAAKLIPVISSRRFDNYHDSQSLRLHFVYFGLIEYMPFRFCLIMRELYSIFPLTVPRLKLPTVGIMVLHEDGSVDAGLYQLELLTPRGHVRSQQDIADAC